MSPPMTNDEPTDPPGRLASHEQDDALLARFGAWLHHEELLDQHEQLSDLDLHIPAPIEAAEPIAAAEPTPPQDAASGPSGLRAWTGRLLRYGAVAAATVLALQAVPNSLWGADSRREVGYELALHGGEAQALAPAEPPRSFSPQSTFGFTLRPAERVDESSEVVIQACRSDCTSEGVFIRLDDTQVESSSKGVIHYSGRTHEVLPLAPGPWTLHFFVGAPGQCVLASLQQTCALVETTTIHLEHESNDAT